jgi:hypothetical protein
MMGKKKVEKEKPAPKPEHDVKVLGKVSREELCSGNEKTKNPIPPKLA